MLLKNVDKSPSISLKVLIYFVLTLFHFINMYVSFLILIYLFSDFLQCTYEVEVSNNVS